VRGGRERERAGGGGLTRCGAAQGPSGQSHCRGVPPPVAPQVNFPVVGLDMRPYIGQPRVEGGCMYDLYAVSVSECVSPVCPSAPLWCACAAARLTFPVSMNCVAGMCPPSYQNHSGDLFGGHYTATVMDSDTGKWYSLDDSNVTEVWLAGLHVPPCSTSPGRLLSAPHSSTHTPATTTATNTNNTRHHQHQLQHQQHHHHRQRHHFVSCVDHRMPCVRCACWQERPPANLWARAAHACRPPLRPRFRLTPTPSSTSDGWSLRRSPRLSPPSAQALVPVPAEVEAAPLWREGAGNAGAGDRTPT
jgi:hypothetical protein